MRFTFNTLPEQAEDIIRTLLSSYDESWHTYDDELVNMYLDDYNEAVLSLRTGKLSIYHWDGLETLELIDALDG